jgi:hypothetical protein
MEEVPLDHNAIVVTDKHEIGFVYATAVVIRVVAGRARRSARVDDGDQGYDTVGERDLEARRA